MRPKCDIIGVNCMHRAEALESKHGEAERVVQGYGKGFKDLAQTTGDIPYVTDTQGVLPFVGHQVENYGFRVEDVVGRNLVEFIYPEDVENVINDFKQTVEHGKEVVTTFRVETPKMGIRYFEDNGRALRDDEGQAIGVSGLLRDVTERQQAEEALHESEAHYRLLADNVTDVIWTTDLNLRFTYVSPSVFRLLGYTVEEYMGLKVEEIIPPTSLEIIAQILADELNAERSSDQIDLARSRRVEFESMRKDGSIVQTEATVTFLRDADGQPVGILGVSRDITERKRAEEALQKAHDELESRVEQRTTELAKANEQLRQEIAERRRAEEELRNSEERLRILFECAPDAYYLNDLQGNFVDGNRAAEEMVGHARSELIGENFLTLRLLPPEEVPKAAELLVRQAEGQSTGPDEFTLIRRDGHRLTLEIMTFPVKIKGQDLVLAIARDISERKRAEEIIQRKLEFERTISDISSRFIGISDIDEAINASLADMGRLSGAGRAYVFLFREDGRTMDNTHEWCAEGVSAQIDNLQNLPAEMAPWWMSKLRRGEVIHIRDVSKLPPEAQAEREILESQDIKSALVLPLNVGGRLAGFIGYDNVVEAGEWSDDDLLLLRLSSEIVGNALQRQRAEDALRQSEHNYKTLFDTSLEGVFVIDGETLRVVLGNQRVAQMYGFDSPEDAIGADPLEFVHPDDRERIARALVEDGFGKDLRQVNEFRTITRDGGQMWMDAVGAITEFQGRIVALVSIRDITQRRRAEEELRQLYEQERKLRQELETEITRRIDFTRSLVHELKTPLTTVMASGDLLATELTEGHLARIVRNLNRTALNLNNRIDELLDLAKGELGILRISPGPVDLLQLLHEVVEDMTPVASSQGQSIILDLPSTLAPVRADGDRLRQVVMNLLNNAFKFTPEGGKTILRARQQDSALLVEVQNPGEAITEEEEERLFEPYYRAEQDRQRFSGLGLGLALCKTIVELHGGLIWVESKYGEGNTFGFSVPLPGNVAGKTSVATKEER